MTENTANRRLPVPLLALGAFALVARMLAMALFPLTDKTEARYGEIARKMAETNNWVTPQIDYGVPFWAKPPLSTWLSAASIDVFGVNEFAARFPSLVIAALIVPMVYMFTRNYLNQPARLASALMLSTMGMFYVAMGTVMTDMTLVLACTAAMIGFWFALEEKSRVWGYVFFGALGLGLLAKGPVAVVLCGMPLFVWVCWTNSWKKMFTSVPVVFGPLWTLVIGVPWYIIAEAKTPGFLHYFIIGEHFERFVVPGWKGDLYGRAHEQPLGMIWPFLLADGMPWSAILLGVFGYRALKRQKVLQGGALDSQTKFLLCWLILPNLFFTFAHNIIPTYPLVSLPALAVLAARELAPLLSRENNIRRWVYACAATLPAAMVIGLAVLSVRPALLTNTAYYVSHTFRQDAKPDGELVYVGNDIYSMDFYNHGKAKHYPSVEEAVAAAAQTHDAYLALTDRQSKDIPPQVAGQMKLVARAAPKYLIYEVEPK